MPSLCSCACHDDPFAVQIVLSLSVSASGIEALANLRDLEAISFDSLHAAPAALKAVSKLTSLRVAEVRQLS